MQNVTTDAENKKDSNAAAEKLDQTKTEPTNFAELKTPEPNRNKGKIVTDDDDDEPVLVRQRKRKVSISASVLITYCRLFLMMMKKSGK